MIVVSALGARDLDVDVEHQKNKLPTISVKQSVVVRTNDLSINDGRRSGGSLKQNSKGLEKLLLKIFLLLQRYEEPLQGDTAAQNRPVLESARKKAISDLNSWT